MAAESGSSSYVPVQVGPVSENKNETDSPQPIVVPSSSSSPPPAKRSRNEDLGVRSVGGRVYDPSSGKTCHQCRRKTTNFTAACKKPRKNKICTMLFCKQCLSNRYGENAEEVAELGDWCCPKCRGICNCSICMKKRGLQPTGALISTARAAGFVSVSEMLTKGAKCVNREVVLADNVAPLEQDAGFLPLKQKDKFFEGNLRDLVDQSSEFYTEEKEDDRTDTDKSFFEFEKVDLYAEFPLPLGTELKTVAGIDLPAEDTGNAVQFLEFCTVFGKVLELKMGHPEDVLREIFHGQNECGEEVSTVVQLHILLLYILLTDQGEECATLSSPEGKNTWFVALKKLLGESPTILNQYGLRSLETVANYETLDAAAKLRLLNWLCDELLCTKKLRNWITDEKRNYTKMIKEAKKEASRAKKEERSLKKQLKDDIAKAIVADHGPPSISEHEAIVSPIKSKLVQAQAKVPESKGIFLKGNQTSDAVRIQPLLRGRDGHAYWKLNCCDKSDVLHQYIGQGDILNLDEKWFMIDDEGKEAIEKHIFALK